MIPELGSQPVREVDMLRRALALLTERLPPGWETTMTENLVVPGRRVGAVVELDAVVELIGSDGARVLLVMDVKLRSLLVRDLPAIVDRLHASVAGLSEPEVPMVPVVVARYLGPSVRAWLEDRGVSYLDATGNLRIVVQHPALYLRDKGADRDPWRGPGRPRGTLRGPPAARVVRALVDFTPPMTVPELVQRSRASTGATYRVVEFLEQEGMIERVPRGPITGVEWRRMLERWSEDYSFQRSNAVSAYLQPRGIPALLDDLRAAAGLRYALTGSLAAQRLAPYAQPRLAMLYVDDPAVTAEQLELRAVDAGANVLLAVGDYDVAFDRTVEVDELSFVAPSQTAVDLLTSPGRGPAEAQALLEWMQTHESDWRR
ncbi:MAG: type IV toxin-antitoxin system AbiEi family antitoxin [Pseudonocardiaceae bacterium]